MARAAPGDDPTRLQDMHARDVLSTAIQHRYADTYVLTHRTGTPDSGIGTARP